MDDELVEKMALVLYNKYRARVAMHLVDNIGANTTAACEQCRDDARAALQVVKEEGWRAPVFIVTPDHDYTSWKEPDAK